MFTVIKSFSGKVSGSKGHVIEIKDKENTYSYCYNGSIDLVKEGVCENEEIWN